MKAGIDYIGASVGVMLLNEMSEILLVKRSQNAKNERGHWEAPGGAIDFGEKMEDAARREMREELGVEVDIVEQLPAEDHLIPGEHQHWVATTFVAKLKPGNAPKILEPHKHDETSWFSMENLPEPLSIITQLNVRRYKKLHPA